MFTEMDKPVLFLEDGPNTDRLVAAVEEETTSADSPLAVAHALTEEAPGVLVVSSEARWAPELLAAMPAAQRPAVVAVGEERPSLFGLVDRWLPAGASGAQVASCLSTARDRARLRTLSGEILWRDAETGLPTRDALLSILVRKAERAQREAFELCVVVVEVERGLAEAATLLGGSTRHNEITARVGRARTATLVQGAQHIAERVRGRFETLLQRAQIRMRALTTRLELGNELVDLMSALDAHLPERAAL